MKKYNKKIALILVLALSLALAVPALAQQTNIQGSYTATGKQVINVEITGGSTIKAFLNPGGYDANLYTCGQDADPEHDHVESNCGYDVLKSSGDITTLPIIGVNKGQSAVAVRASVTSTITGNFKFASSAPSQKTTTGLVWLEAKYLGNPTSNEAYDLEYDTEGNFSQQKVVNAMNGWKRDWDETVKVAGVASVVSHSDWLNKKNVNIFEATDKKVFTGAFNALKKTGQKSTDKADLTGFKDEIVILKKGTVESKNQLCVVAEAVDKDTPTYFIARLSGKVGEGDKTKIAKSWNSNDGFGATVIWTFQAMDESLLETNANADAK